MNILVTNDDGIHAPGLWTLVEALTTLGTVTVVDTLPPGLTATALGGVVAVEADDDRMRQAAVEHADRVNDPVGDGVAGGDATEDVHEHTVDGGVGQDDARCARNARTLQRIHNDR